MIVIIHSSVLLQKMPFFVTTYTNKLLVNKKCMPNTKKTKSKKKVVAAKVASKIKKVAAVVVADSSDSLEPIPSKIKKPTDLELPEEAPVIFENKDDDEVPLDSEEAEEIAADEPALDDEELNPFGDKWEQ